MHDRLKAFKTITAKNNPHHRYLQNAARGKCPDLVWLEGFRLCETALEAGFFPQAVVCSRELFTPAQVERFVGLLDRLHGRLPDVRLRLNLSPALMKGLCATVRPQGILMLVDRPVPPLPDPSEIRRGFLVAEHLQDPGNMGTLIRIADAFALDGLMYTANCADPWQDKVVRASMGSVFHIPLIRFVSTSDLFSFLNRSNISTLAAALEGEDLKAVRADLPAALLIGNEGRGLSAETLALADRRVTISMPGRSESLNAAVAAGICCFHFFS
jgi:TrmH family RNA methyltransferase